MQLFLFFALAALASGAAPPSCSCGEILQQRDVTIQAHTPSSLTCYQKARTTYVRSAAQAEYLCANTAIGENPCTWMIVEQLLTPLRDVHVSATLTETVNQPLFRVQIADVSPTVPPGRQECATNTGAVTEYHRIPSATGDVWTDRCSKSICPTPPIGTAPLQNPEIWEPFVTVNAQGVRSLICNMDKCRADHQGGCKCNTGLCDCAQLDGQPGLFTGGACAKFRPEVCMSKNPMSFATYIKKVRSSDLPDPRQWAVDLPICNYIKDINGRAACQNLATGLKCYTCQADTRPPQPIQAFTGPLCNVTMCSPACKQNGGTCHRVCLDHQGKKHYCFNCKDQCVPQSYGQCLCEQQPSQTFFGDHCQYSFLKSEFTPTVADPPGFPGCYTGFEGDGYTPWFELDIGERNKQVCGGNGVCSAVRTGERGYCICDRGFLVSTRCTTIDRCLLECSTNITRARCTMTGSRVNCACTPLWYGPTCDSNGCASGSVINGECHCPSGTVWVPRGQSDSSNKQVGCRILCPMSAGKECGDGDTSRCTSGFAPGPPGVCTCDRGWTTDGHGSCEPLCVHGTWSQSIGCTCTTEPGYDGKPHAVWTGTRCDESLCKHGSTWSTPAERCLCEQALPPYNVAVGDDVYCNTPSCVPPHTWDGHSCVCAFPYDSASCGSLCGEHGAPEGAACACISGWTGQRCDVSLCTHGGHWSGDGCACPHPEVWSGPYCSTSLCADGGWTQAALDDRCVCASVLLSGAHCDIDGCAPLGQAIRSSYDGSWRCSCHTYTFELDGGMRCGCPASRVLDPCRDPDDVGLDPRCLPFSNSGLQRCICGHGQDVNKAGACIPLQCYTAGTNATRPYRLVDGYWTCTCKDGWSGHLCDQHKRLGNDALCGYNATWTGEDCLCDPLLPTVHVMDRSAPRGQYCALDCWNDGVYQFVTNRCLCVTGFSGGLCEIDVRPPPPKPEQSTGGAAAETHTTSNQGLVIGLSTAGGAVALAALITGIVLGVKKFHAS